MITPNTSISLPRFFQSYTQCPCHSPFDSKSLRLVCRLLWNEVEGNLWKRDTFLSPTIPPSISSYCYERTSEDSETQSCTNMIYNMRIFFLPLSWNQFCQLFVKASRFRTHSTRGCENKGWKGSLLYLQNSVVVTTFLFPFMLDIELLWGRANVRRGIWMEN